VFLSVLERKVFKKLKKCSGEGMAKKGVDINLVFMKASE
jgi:hypothetical protein